MMITEIDRETGEEMDYYPEEYAAFWGCTAWDDKPPNLVGDGSLFYNFGSEVVEKTPYWLRTFLGAIDRTIQKVSADLNSDDPNWVQRDLDNLNLLRDYVEEMLAEKENPKRKKAKPLPI